jgi:hypothetical protein
MSGTQMLTRKNSMDNKKICENEPMNPGIVESYYFWEEKRIED